jgi:hypothetical protein
LRCQVAQGVRKFYALDTSLSLTIPAESTFSGFAGCYTRAQQAAAIGTTKRLKLKQFTHSISKNRVLGLHKIYIYILAFKGHFKI